MVRSFLLCFSCLLGALDAKDEAVVLVVDPSWDDVGSFGPNVPLLKEYNVVKVMIREGKSHSFSEGYIDVYRTITYSSRKPNTTLATAEICPQLKSLGMPVAAIMPTSDPTVALTDNLAACVGVRGNPATGPLAHARRNKWVMGNAVRKYGLRTMREKLVSNWEEAQSYLERMDPPLSKTTPVIFKILNGAGGQGVMKVHNMLQAKEIFASEHTAEDDVGGVNAETSILIQEYLVGKEYAIDTVSRDGVHKVVAVWFEDFRPANGVFDQYFGFKLLDPKDALTKVIIEYANGVLEATGLHNGAANTEIKILEGENVPCLVEINARWAGIGWHDGLAVEKASVGIDQYNAAFNAYLDADAFNSMPDVMPLKQHGAVVFGINYEQGILVGIPGIKAAMQSSSYLDSDVEVDIAKPIAKTTPNNIPVNIALAHNNELVVDADYANLINLEKKRVFFDVIPDTVVGGTALRVSKDSLAAWRSLAFFAFAMLAGAGVVMIVRITASRREAKDGTEYLAIA